jgi:uncharacterized protein YbaP (TraB family)
MQLRFKKLSITLFIGLAFFTSFYAHAQESDQNPSKNILWRVQSETNTIYLQGSLHLLKSSDYPLNPVIEKAFADSRILVLEADPGKMNTPENQQLLMQKGMLPQGDSLEKHLDAKTFEMVGKATAELGLDIAMFQPFKPWMFSMILTVSALQRHGFSTEYGIDTYFYNKAINEAKPVIALETIEYQLELFDNFSSILQNDLIQQTLKDLENIKEKVDEIIQAWSTGDASGLDAFLFDSFKEYPGIYNAVITKRNMNWMSHIESFMKQKENHMIIVGAGHLVGENGLVALLKKKGYKPEQL